PTTGSRFMPFETPSPRDPSTERPRPLQGLASPTPSPAGGATPGYPFLLPPVMPDEIGRLGSYRVLRLLGQGGVGVVFLAEAVPLHRPVALKVLKPELSDPEGWQRFLREARLLAASKHDNLVTIFQAGQENGVAFFAMELLEGESLAASLDRGAQVEVGEVI